MPAAKPKYMPDPRGWTQEQVAARLNVSVGWLLENRENLYRAGMPRPDAGMANRTDSKALEAWMDRRSGLIDWNAGTSDADPFAERIRGSVHGEGRA